MVNEQVELDDELCGLYIHKDFNTFLYMEFWIFFLS